MQIQESPWSTAQYRLKSQQKSLWSSLQKKPTKQKNHVFLDRMQKLWLSCWEKQDLDTIL